jgi:hypothetical protein
MQPRAYVTKKGPVTNRIRRHFAGIKAARALFPLVGISSQAHCRATAFPDHCRRTSRTSLGKAQEQNAWEYTENLGSGDVPEGAQDTSGP